MAVVQGTLRTLPAETWETQAPALQSGGWRSETSSRRMASQFHLQGAVCIGETTDINPTTDTRDFVSLPPDQLAAFLEQSFSLRWQKDASFFQLLGHHENQTATTLPTPNNRYMERQGSQPSRSLLLTKATVCCFRTENVVPPRSGKQQ